MTELLRTPLYDLAIAQKARFTEFSGWEMAVQYQGLKSEHQAVRKQVGMFDISHMGKLRLSGRNLSKQLNYLVPTDLSKLTGGQAQYTVLLNPQGGIIDDLIFYCQGEDTGLIIVNAATTTKDKNWLRQNLASKEIEVTDVGSETVLIALQGPQAVAKLESILGNQIRDLPSFGHLTSQLGAHQAFIARTGYTGEDGFEIMIETSGGKELWRSLLNLGVTPCGLGARDTLRLEAGMALYGQDIDEKTTPLEAGLGWLVDWDTGDFIGKNKLLEQKTQGVKRRLVGLQMQEKGIARHGYPVVVAGEIVGEVTSGTFAPTLEQAIALAYLPKVYSKVGQMVKVDIRGKLYSAQVVKKPFYKKATKENSGA